MHVQAKDRLALILLVLATTPADNTLAVEVKLEVVDCFWGVGWSNAVAKPKLRGRIRWNVDGNESLLRIQEGRQGGEGVIRRGRRSILRKLADVELRGDRYGDASVCRHLVGC